MNDEQLKNALATELINTMPFNKVLELVKGFSEAIATQQIDNASDEERAALIARFSPEPVEAVEPKKKRSRKKAATK